MGKRIARNMLFSGASWVTTAVVALVSVPITVNGLGDDGYGVMALVGTLTGYLGVLDLGMGQGIVRYVARFAALDYGRSMRETVRAVAVWFLGVGAAGALAMWFLAPWLTASLFDIPSHLTADSIAAFRLGGASFLLSMLSTVAALIPEAFLRYDIASVINGILATAALAGPAVLVSMGFGLVPVMWFAVALAGVALIAWGWVAVRLVRPLPHDGPPFSEFRREFIGFALTTGTNRAWGVLSKQTARAVVGIAGGAAQVAYYQVPSQVSDRVNQLLSRTGRVLLPTSSQLAADGDVEAIRALYTRSSRLFFLLNAASAGAVVAFASPLLEHWIGPRFSEAGTWALSFLVLASAVNATSQSASRVNLALGRPKVNLVSSVANSIILLATVYWLTVWLGVTGTALAGLLAAGVVPFFLHYSHTRVLSVSSWMVFRECYLRTTLAVLAVSVLGRLVFVPLSTSLGVTLALAALTGAVSLAVAAAVGGTTRDDWQTLRYAFSRDRGGGGGDAGA